MRHRRHTTIPSGMAIYYLIVLDRQVIISRSTFQIGLDLHAVLQSVLAYLLHTLSSICLVCEPIY